MDRKNLVFLFIFICLLATSPGVVESKKPKGGMMVVMMGGGGGGGMGGGGFGCRKRKR